MVKSRHGWRGGSGDPYVGAAATVFHLWSSRVRLGGQAPTGGPVFCSRCPELMVVVTPGVCRQPSHLLLTYVSEQLSVTLQK